MKPSIRTFLGHGKHSEISLFEMIVGATTTQQLFSISLFVKVKVWRHVSTSCLSVTENGGSVSVSPRESRGDETKDLMFTFTIRKTKSSNSGCAFVFLHYPRPTLGRAIIFCPCQSESRTHPHVDCTPITALSLHFLCKHTSTIITSSPFLNPRQHKHGWNVFPRLVRTSEVFDFSHSNWGNQRVVRSARRQFPERSPL